MIVGGRFLTVSCAKHRDAPIAAVNIDISISNITLRTDGDMEIRYIYTVRYEDSIGELRIEGVLYNREEDLQYAQKIASSFANDRRALPQDFLERMVNTINYICSINSTLPLRLIDLAPPILPPTLTINREEVSASATS